MPPSIHPWLGEFTDPALEEAYRQRHLRSQWRRAELGTGVVVAIWTCYIGLDALLYPEVAAATFPWRVLFLVYTVPAMVLARRWPERVTDLTTVGMVVYATSLALAFHTIGTPSATVGTWLSVTVFGMSAWAILPVRRQAWVELYTTCVLSAVALLHLDGSRVDRVVSVGVVSFVMAMGFHLAAERRERLLQAEIWKNEAEVEARTLLLASVAHELRTPLAASRAAVALGKVAPETTSEMWDAMEHRLDHLAVLVDAILKFGKLDLGVSDGSHEPVDLRSLLETVADDVRVLRSDVRIEVLGRGSTTGDPSLLRSALTGLASNAIRHAAGSVRLSAGQDDRSAWLEVHDDGPGVPMDLRQRIFEPLVSVGPRRAKGLGMGLAIAARIVSAHGGAIDVATSELGGARFRIELPPT